MNNLIKAAILVGGQGTRLRSLFPDLPKPLVPINGTPFLFLLLKKLKAVGITNIVLLTGYKHEMIQAMCGDGSQLGLQIEYSKEDVPLGSGGALKAAEKYFPENHRILLLNGDTYPDFSLTPFIHFTPTLAAIGVSYLKGDISRYGTVEFNQETKHILSFHEKQKMLTHGYLYTGIGIIQPEIFAHIPANQMCSLEQDVLPTLLKQEKVLEVIICDGIFKDIGLPESYQEFCQEISYS